MKIYADPNQLEQTASLIDGQVQEYENEYKSLYLEVEKMQAGWKGKDNLVFTEQITSFQSDFMKMTELMKEYSSFLKNSATVYRNVQDELMNKARQLRF